MKLYAPFAKVDAEQRLVAGYASTEALDSQNEIVTRAALAKALQPYMKFANIREMHGASAVGVAHEAELDDKGLYLSARIVDPLAWEKVRTGVYKGFSIGGHVTARDPAERHIITGLDLNEISIVDRPANPEALFDVWKADLSAGTLAKDGRRNSAEDQQHLDAAHDAIVAAGAHCPGCDGEKGTGIGDLAKRNEALASENTALKAELASFKARPEPMRGKVLALGKAEEVLPTGAAAARPSPYHDKWFTTRT